jgi:hypothetical protein
MPDTVHLNGDAAIQQYSDYNVHLYLDVDLTGFEVKAAFKREYTEEIAIAFTTGILQTSNPAIIKLSLTNEQTAILAPGTYKWDLWIRSGGVGQIRTISQGNITVEPGVTINVNSN